MLVGLGGEALLYLPEGRTSVSLPDDDRLWDTMWAIRDFLCGFAHTHPFGVEPSQTDLQTWAAIEAGLGKRLLWWIADRERVACYRWFGVSYEEISTEAQGSRWLQLLREASFQEGS